MYKILKSKMFFYKYLSANNMSGRVTVDTPSGAELKKSTIVKFIFKRYQPPKIFQPNLWGLLPPTPLYTQKFVFYLKYSDL